jgi:hypothetical protein
MPASPEAVRRYRRHLANYRLRTSALLVATWNRLGSYDRDDIATYEEQTAIPTAGVKQATTGLAAAFLTLTLDVEPTAVDPDAIDVTLHTSGPFHAMWHALKEDRPFTEALQVGRSTASATGYDFVQRVARRTGDHVAEANGLDLRWRRVPGANACDWCRLVSRDDYRTAESADFGHERDDCIVIPA